MILWTESNIAEPLFLIRNRGSGLSKHFTKKMELLRAQIQAKFPKTKNGQSRYFEPRVSFSLAVRCFSSPFSLFLFLCPRKRGCREKRVERDRERETARKVSKTDTRKPISTFEETSKKIRQRRRNGVPEGEKIVDNAMASLECLSYHPPPLRFFDLSLSLCHKLPIYHFVPPYGRKR